MAIVKDRGNPQSVVERHIPVPSDHQYTYSLLSNASASSGVTNGVRGGSYVFAASGTWNGATAALQATNPDGTTWQTVASLTANGTVGVVIGSNASVRVLVSGGPPAALYASLS